MSVDTTQYITYCNGICPSARQRFGKHIPEVAQSTVEPRLLSSQRFSEHGFRGNKAFSTDTKTESCKHLETKPLLRN
jgi:hypothetical protein